MKKGILFALFSLLMPGLGYILLGDSRRFYSTIFAFYSIVILGSVFRLYPVFSGFIFIISSLLIIHVLTATHAFLGRSKNQPAAGNGFLKWAFTIFFFATTVTTFGNARTMLGFDRVSMGVKVMEPGIMSGEQLLADTWAYKSHAPQRGDIVIHLFKGQKGVFLNRIVAVGGDAIKIEDGNVWINGLPSKEDYVIPGNRIKDVSIKMPLMVVPVNGYFVMGDNRDKSLGDSRFSGPIDLKDIKGRVTYILYSQDLSRIGRNLNKRD